MALTSLTYTSLARLDLQSSDLEEIHRSARELNALDGITGLLVFNGTHFLQIIEGVGLWMRRAWAEWFTVIATASLIPFELWELIMRPPDRRLAVLATALLNLTILWYLVRLLRRTAQARARDGLPP